MKKRSLQEMSAVALGGGILVWLFIWHGHRRDLPIQDLLVPNPSFPQTWLTGEVPIGFIEWQMVASTAEQRPAFFAEQEVRRTWQKKGDSLTTPRITQPVFTYTTPGRAAIQYALSRPERAYWKKWSEFTVVPPDMRLYTSAAADREYTVCAMGSHDDCQIWYYWAQYGQYLVETRFFAPNQGIDSKLFDRIVEQVDAYITLRLEGSSRF